MKERFSSAGKKQRVGLNLAAGLTVHSAFDRNVAVI